MSTALDICTAALRLIGVGASGETLPAAEAQDALTSLNQLIQRWNLERLMIHAITLQQFSFVVGQQSYTIGSGGNFNTTRPVRIERATVKVLTQTPNYEVPLQLVTDQEWSPIIEKSLTAEIPQLLWPQMTYGASGLATLWFWPIPSVVNAVVLDTWGPITSLASLSTTVALPPGYEEAMQYGLALKLAPEYGRIPDAQLPTIAEIAAESKAAIKSANSEPVLSRCDSALLKRGGYFDIRTGGPIR